MKKMLFAFFLLCLSGVVSAQTHKQNATKEESPPPPPTVTAHKFTKKVPPLPPLTVTKHTFPPKSKTNKKKQRIKKEPVQYAPPMEHESN